MCLKCMKAMVSKQSTKVHHHHYQQQIEHKEYAERTGSCRSSFASDVDSIDNMNESSDTVHSTPISTPTSTPKPIFTHKLPDNFFSASSPPEPLSPISLQTSRINSPTSSPHIHPVTPKPDTIEKCMESLSLNHHHRLSLDDFIIKQTVGIGSSARVHLAKSKVNGKYYAIKAICKKDLLSKRQVEHAQNERQTLSYVNHPFLVKLWGTFQSESHVFLVMDYVPGGELFRVIRNKKRLSEEEAKFYAAEVTLAIEYLHHLDIAYRDLKPENILLDHRGHIKIADFGFAKVVHDMTWTVCGTPDYLAPEIIRSQGYTKAVDWWGLGVLIYEMITGQSPFYAKNPIDQYQKILECDISWPAFVSPEARDLIEHLLKTKPSERYGNLKDGSNDIKNHPWFKSFDFNDVYARKLNPPFIPNVKYEGDTRCFDYYEELQMPYHLMHTNENFCDHFANF